MAREIGDMAPVRAALAEIGRREAAAADLRDERARSLLADTRQLVAAAVDEAVRPENDDGLTVDEYAAKHGLSRWNVYKMVQRGEIPAKRRDGRLVLPAA